MPRIISWNTQGDCLSKLSESYDMLLSKWNDNIIMIQEAGSIVDKHGCQFPITFGTSERGRHFSAFFSKQYNAKNQRCTTGMLVESGLSVNCFKTYSNSGKRPIAACECACEYPEGVQEFVFATVHSTANEHPAKRELFEIDRIFKDAYGDDLPWLVMGDFNCKAENLNFGTDINIIFPKYPTHQSGHTPDFAICSNILAKKIQIRCPEIVPLESDHFPIYCEL